MLVLAACTSEALIIPSPTNVRLTATPNHALPRPAMPLTRVQSEHRLAFADKLASGLYRLEDAAVCLCGATDAVDLADHDRFGLPVGTVLCRECGLARTTPRLASKNLPAFYEHDYHGLHLDVRDPDPDHAMFRRGQGAAIHAFLVDLLASGPLRIADIGAGAGQVMQEFEGAHDGPVFGVGCEYSSEFVEAGQRAGRDLRHGGPEQITGDAPFDLVILSHVVEHFPDPVRDLTAVRALGHRHTLFYVEVPGLLTIDRKPEYAYRLDQYLTVAHTFHFTRATLAATMARAGFAEVRADENIHAVFRTAPVAIPARDPDHAAVVMASIARLSTWPVRSRSALRQARQRLAATAKSMLPGRVVRAIRRRR